MKEHQEQNEAFVSLHEDLAIKQGKSRDEIIQECITRFKLGGKDPRHSYRAYYSRLKNPAKYDGRYSDRMKTIDLHFKKVIPVVAAQPVEEIQIAAGS